MAQPLKSQSDSTVSDRTLADCADRCRALPAFQAGARAFTQGEILDAAEWRGDLAKFRAVWLERRARAAAAATMEAEPTAKAVDEAVNAFRYARDLVSAEECDRWLDQRGLKFTHLLAAVSRRLKAELAEADTPAELAAGDEAVFCIEAMLSDEFTLWAHRLARRVAVALDAGESMAAPAAMAASLPPWEERMKTTVTAIVTPDRRRRALANQRMGLTRLTLTAAEFDSETAAREARLCVMEDGVALAETADANGISCQQMETFLEELPETWQMALISARPGDVVSPPADPDSGCVRLLHVLRRREPSLEDEGVLAALDTGLVLDRLEELETRHVRWTINLEIEA